jgi:Colicin V production protein.
MNWLFAVVMVIFLIGMIIGIVRGGVRVAVSLGATLVTFILVIVLSPHVSKLVYEHTPIGTGLEEQIFTTMSKLATTSTLGELGVDEETVQKKLQEYGITETALNQAGITVEDILAGRVDKAELARNGITDEILDYQIEPESEEMTETEVDGLQDVPDIPRQAQRAVIEYAEIPDIFKELLKENNNSEIYEMLGANNFVQYVAKYLAKTILNIIIFLAVFLIITIILRAVIFALDIVTELPVVGLINRLIGMVIGLVAAYVVVCVVLTLIVLLFQTSFGRDMYVLVEASPVLMFLYENNVVLRLALSFK